MAIFCATFLRPEMLHIHRQISGLKNFTPLVITQKREGDWQAKHVEVVGRSVFRFFGRGIEKWLGHPWQITAGETAQMQTAMRRTQASLLHIFFGNVAVHMLPLMRRTELPVVVSFHGADVAGGMATTAYAHARVEMFRRARLVLCRSDQLAKKVVSLGCDASKVRIMRTVLPPIESFVHSPPPDGGWRLVQAARLIPKKGFATALHAFAEFLKFYPSSKFTIAGEGPLEGELRELAASLGISGNVEFRGFLSQDALAQLYSVSHIFLHPSESVNGDVEGIPNSLLEAMASGLPAVATDHGGIPEVIQNGVTGLLCPERNGQELSAALLRLAGDPAFYKRVSRTGAEFVSREFSAEKQIANLENLYSEAMEAA